MNKRVILLIAVFLTAFPVYARKHPRFSPPTHSTLTQPIDGPKDQEVCFSPEEPCDVKLLKFIQSAQKSIDVAIYDITLDAVVHALLVQSKKIPVRIIADRRQSKGPHSLVPLLIKAGINIRYGHQRGIFHNKFTIIDRKMVETGSFNYTNHATKANSESQVYLANSLIVEKYQKHFDELWSQADPISGSKPPKEKELIDF
jgi:phosphatidylserine/phosphatidylglycerophosphate/cardiolipin synthase-like enzyme